MTSDPSLEGDTKRFRGSKSEEKDAIKINSDSLKPRGSRKEELDQTSVESDLLKPQIERRAKTNQVSFGVSSMDAEIDLGRGTSDKPSALVSTAEDSKDKFGVSSMDADLIPRDSSAERVAHSSNRERLDKEEYIKNHEFTKLDKMFSVLSISVKKANSVRNPTKFIYDTAAGCCICNTKEVFVSGSIRMIPDNQVSIVGFNTYHGPAIALGVGRLKYLDIDAYYSESSIGNILGEPELLKYFQKQIMNMFRVRCLWIR